MSFCSTDFHVRKIERSMGVPPVASLFGLAGKTPHRFINTKLKTAVTIGGPYRPKSLHHKSATRFYDSIKNVLTACPSPPTAASQKTSSPGI